jgi:hypothetical protein
MTTSRFLCAIDEAAALAAESAWDAFGSDPVADLPTPEMAWAFLNESVYAEGAVDRPAALPDFLPRQFGHDYRRHIRILAENRTSGVAWSTVRRMPSAGLGKLPMFSVIVPVLMSFLEAGGDIFRNAFR